MGKSILMSIQPQWVCKILNGEKTIEIRKKFPKDYVGWVYIYCTKSSNCCLLSKIEDNGGLTENGTYREYQTYGIVTKRLLNKFGLECGETDLSGKVVTRFWCDKVEEIRCSWGSNFIDWSKYPSDERYDYYIGNEMDTCDICRVACLKMEELDNYLKGKKGYAIHISKLEVFDKPKELKELKTRRYPQFANMEKNTIHYELVSVKKAPQSYMFIKGE